MTATAKLTKGLRTVASDIAQGFFEITHNGFALLGLAVMFAAIALTTQPEIRQAGEVKLFGFLQSRLGGNAAEGVDVEGVDRATASNPQDLPKRQAAVAFWLSKKYGIAPEPLSTLVAEAYTVGARTKLDPNLILAVMAIESGFNPFAQSAMGAQGLMQVMTKVHGDKYDNFGGKFAAFDPISNLHVGVKVLQECISRAGSIEGGLKFYVGAANLDSDNGYAAKVLAEHQRLTQVANGAKVPFAAPQVIPASVGAEPTPRESATRS
ncbi:lytic transglycosylase domain-containing protein [Curvibacter sp. APW13]|uniref:lytic transglycosylase domain-containing protein n=1 Tax=Curvibacter sp. APW13 TaxID=3077236 RepID=UPI0028E04CF1|nr:lytic transglycosylase domain-containing protein [Curvibacter sp. APW13]MDT8991417.1 lytic transglycosylase domain-containing protein [Curvibacter sp. APW13]